MAYPIPIVHCEACESRFILEPGAFVEDAALEIVRLLCRHCRAEDASGEES